MNNLELGWLTAVAQIALSLIGGGIAGAAVTYYLQNHGKIERHASRWQSHDSGTDNSSFRFHLLFFNETAMPKGLWQCCVVFSAKGKELASVQPKRVIPENDHNFIFGDNTAVFSVVDLPVCWMHATALEKLNRLFTYAKIPVGQYLCNSL